MLPVTNQTNVVKEEMMVNLWSTFKFWIGHLEYNWVYGKLRGSTASGDEFAGAERWRCAVSMFDSAGKFLQNAVSWSWKIEPKKAQTIGDRECIPKMQGKMLKRRERPKENPRARAVCRRRSILRRVDWEDSWNRIWRGRALWSQTIETNDFRAREAVCPVPKNSTTFLVKEIWWVLFRRSGSADSVSTFWGSTTPTTGAWGWTGIGRGISGRIACAITVISFWLNGVCTPRTAFNLDVKISYNLLICCIPSCTPLKSFV